MSEANDDQKVPVEPTSKEHQKERRIRKQGDLKPCERCRSQHLKCVYNAHDPRCQRCERSGNDCIRSTKKIRFRDVPASRFHTDRRSRKVSTIKATGSKLAVSKNAASINQSVADLNHSESMDAVPSESLQDDSDEQEDAEVDAFAVTSAPVHFVDPIVGVSTVQSAKQMSTYVQQPTRSDSNKQDTDTDMMFAAALLPPTPSDDRLSLSEYYDNASLTRVFSSDMNSIMSGSPQTRGRRASSSRYLDQLVRSQARDVPQNSHDYLENVLLRYFHEELAPWFDLCDPDRHFATVIPQRARAPGPLRSAILTISARNMSRNRRFRNSAGVVEWKGRPLPDLKEEFAVPYHNECIRDLLQLSMNPRKLQDENLLAAVLALRTDEEMGLDTGDSNDDQQLFLRIASVFIDAQLPPALALPHSSPTVFPSTIAEEYTQSEMVSPSVHTDDLGASGLRQACFWTAFRQDLHASFLKQQPVRFPLSRCEVFRQLSPATDAVWANRMVTFCADVLEFSYGSDSSDGKVMPSYTNQDRWRELRDREKLICGLLPATFEPTFCSEPELLHGIFPEIWYLDPCHVSGTTYIELARMLLQVFDPTRPKLGHGFLAATNAFINSSKKVLFRLCGIALSNHHCPPSLINACLGIAMFGEYFDDLREQTALLGVLELMHNRYAYPTSQIAQSLKRAWHNEDLEGTSSIVSYNPTGMD
ncbi:hypothetical protein LTR64_003995 [Lithohypha guttulata]|uniref:uncharacterized protein n=1 Tax=Lithohypha guttulata TaxID=1690604 RepID=UPI002DDF90BF|nr:hypothetical protein LTR51_006709 [Lithohypha guttulata]